MIETSTQSPISTKNYMLIDFQFVPFISKSKNAVRSCTLKVCQMMKPRYYDAQQVLITQDKVNHVNKLINK